MSKQILNTFLADSSAPATLTVTSGTSGTGIYKLFTEADAIRIVKPRELFSHKGTYGHVLVVAGQEQTMGAALLSSSACLYAGAGLTTVSIPSSGLTALNSSFPELMFLERKALAVARNLDKFTVIAVGPGLGTTTDAKKHLQNLFKHKQPMVIDADALNILGVTPELFKKVPKGSVLTPHMNEFDRLFGKHESWFKRVETARMEARERSIIIVLKNQYTFIIDSSGNVHINLSGGPAMAQGGMGDVLTGLIAAYMAQGYAGIDAAQLACYIHGSSGDQLAKTHYTVTASEVAKHVPILLKSLLK
ncbi:MAG: NAD(P)H-hydrate dehydratase [Pedobacter sp.]|nr:MAG: NAD(P)H-hydrate dehydratase [Pedobacter sp.]